VTLRFLFTRKPTAWRGPGLPTCFRIQRISNPLHCSRN